VTNVAHDRRPVENHFLQDENGNPTGGYSEGEGFRIAWQNGVQVRQGAFLEEVLEACKARFEFFQSSKFACLENEEAILGINTALHWMLQRRHQRARRGVEGTYNP